MDIPIRPLQGFAERTTDRGTFMVRRAAVVAAVVAALLAPASAAFADNCFNVSRSSQGLSTDPSSFTSGPVFVGRWVWLPSVGVPLPYWGFGPPENYQNGNPDHWLLAKTPYCAAGGFVNPDGTPRTYDHGIQSGCGAFG